MRRASPRTDADDGTLARQDLEHLRGNERVEDRDVTQRHEHDVRRGIPSPAQSPAAGSEGSGRSTGLSPPPGARALLLGPVAHEHEAHVRLRRGIATRRRECSRARARCRGRRCRARQSGHSIPCVARITGAAAASGRNVSASTPLVMTATFSGGRPRRIRMSPERLGDHDDQGGTAVQEHLERLEHPDEHPVPDDPELDEDAGPEIAHFEDVRHAPEPMGEAHGDGDEEGRRGDDQDVRTTKAWNAQEQRRDHERQVTERLLDDSLVGRGVEPVAPHVHVTQPLPSKHGRPILVWDAPGWMIGQARHDGDLVSGVRPRACQFADARCGCSRFRDEILAEVCDLQCLVPGSWCRWFPVIAKIS